MTNHPVVPRAEWLAARTAFLEKEKAFTQQRDAGCPHCSSWADNFNGAIVHMNHRDTTMVAISRQFQESGSPDVRTRRLQ